MKLTRVVCGLAREAETLSSPMTAMIDKIERHLKHSDKIIEGFETKDALFIFREKDPKAEVLCTNAEDGCSATVLYPDGVWMYRPSYPSERPEYPVPQGEHEVFNNWVSYFEG